MANAIQCFEVREVIHFGSSNLQNKYYLEDQEIEVTDSEKDLGVIIQQNLDSDRQVANVTMKANRVLGMIARTSENKQTHNILRLYKTLVRPHLEYAVQVWRPHKQKHINLIESVQRRTTKIIQGMRTLDYKERLEQCKLVSLEMRRRRADLIEMFKIMKGHDQLEAEDFFELSTSKRTRGTH